MRQKPIDDKILQAIREQIKAEYETAAQLKKQNDLAEESLKALERTRTTESIRNQLWMGISEQSANIVQQFPDLVYQIAGFSEKLGDYGEFLETLSERLDRIEYGMMLILDGKNNNGNRAKSRALVKDIERERAQRLLERHQSRLHELKMQVAAYGTYATPAHLTLEIEDLEQEIARLERQND